LSAADVDGVNLPTRALTAPSQAEMGLIFAAKYETDLRIEAAQARRGFHGVSLLIAVAAIVFGYDAVFLMLGR
jgi:hypothetical protein